MRRQKPADRLSRMRSFRASTSANRHGSIELSIDAGLNEGSGGSRFSPEPAYPSALVTLTLVHPVLIQQRWSILRHRQRRSPKQNPKARPRRRPHQAQFHRRLRPGCTLHEWMMQNIAIPARQAAASAEAHAGAQVQQGPAQGPRHSPMCPVRNTCASQKGQVESTIEGDHALG